MRNVVVVRGVAVMRGVVVVRGVAVIRGVVCEDMTVHMERACVYIYVCVCGDGKVCEHVTVGTSTAILIYACKYPRQYSALPLPLPPLPTNLPISVSVSPPSVSSQLELCPPEHV